MSNKVTYWISACIASLACIFLIQQSNQYFHNEEIITERIEQELRLIEQDVASTLLDRKLFVRLLNSLEQKKFLSNEVIQELSTLAEKPYTIYLYKADSLMFWSKPGLVIEPQYLNLKTFPVVLSDHVKDFLIKKYELYDQQNEYTCFVKIPILSPADRPSNISLKPLTDRNKFERLSTPTTVHSIEGDAICSIRLIGSSFPWTSQLGILILSVIAAFGGLGAITLIIKRFRNKLGRNNTAFTQIAAVVLFRICTFLIGYHDFFSDVGIVQNIFVNQSIFYSLFDFILDGAILLWISSKLSQVLSVPSNIENEKKWIVQLNSVGNFLILILITGLLSWMMRSVVISSNLNMDLEQISFFNLYHFICLFGFGQLTLAALVLIHELIRQNIRLVPNIYSRIFHFVLAAVISLPILGLIPIGASLFGFFLVVFISGTLLDLYIEKGSKSVTWVITWLIAISGFSSVLLYKYQQDNDFIRRVDTLSSVEQKLSEGSGDIEQRLLEWLPRMSPKFSLGIYQDDQMVFNYNYKYPIVLTDDIRPQTINIAEQRSTQRSEVSVKTEDGYWIFAGKKIEGPIGVISLFSYIFTIYSIFLFVIALFNSFADFLPDSLNISFSSRPTLRNKIQLAIVFIILLTFIIIGIVTVFYMRGATELDFERRYEDRLQTLSTAINQSTNTRTWQSAVAQAAKVAYANNPRSKIYDPNGNLIFQKERYPEGRVPPPVKMSFISKMILDLSNKSYTLEKGSQSIQTAAIGFLGISSNQNQSLGYIEFPNIDLMGSIDDPSEHLFSNLLNAYVFLFLIAVALAIAIANSITQPLSELGEKMKLTRLGKKNEPISWNNEDEIGALIQDYNSMIHQLDESAKLLAHNERDLAWREMAKQVAHEIKNPLTPMKLSIQYLQSAIRNGKSNLNEMAGRVSQTLIEQIDNLTNIANEFSNFAKMPQNHHDKVVLNEVIASVHDLFRKREDMDISLYVPIDEIMIFADKNQLIRVFNNVLKNAIQSIPDGKRGKIEIELYKNNQHGIVKIKDNGVGISEEMREKVFYPNFTTKSSGTGLGLAMSSSIIESFDGKIHFETELGIGTTFIIQLPLMRLESNFQQDKRVTL